MKQETVQAEKKEARAERIGLRKAAKAVFDAVYKRIGKVGFPRDIDWWSKCALFFRKKEN